MSKPTVLFELFGLQVYLYGVMVAIGIAAGLYVALSEAKRKGLDPDKITDLSFVLMVGGIVGARLVYVLLNIGNYISHPASLFSIHKGGLAFHGAAFAGIAIVYVFAKKNSVNFMKIADLFAPALILGYAIGRLGCDIYGNETTVAWGVDVFGVTRHPVQFYSAFFAFVIFGVLWYKRKAIEFEGQLFIWLAGLYSGYRFFIEFFRNETSAVTPAQLISLGILAACFIYSEHRKRSGSLVSEGGRK
ncbi:prolipoprotein diacylglyceryl transferase [Dethiobacter alkaliphilus]|uniref:Phosphatidylglycerol--prolipoprotein diacylglyceryl transferase n=1 Tax=Dethiobacter alkaliphilus AHT 1 TaxID=555088 RepID=C0GDQ6_DETAL|nr:prolipoprotein diacylglyceryl transferase [Dethiobacter alkaliphilus]EEG78539.1 prolipoprotein diacylglyceryl transferase [Dethiobacter alkaliphilus AHT 1]